MLLYEKTSKTAGDIITEVDNLLKDTGNDIWTAAEKLYALKQAVRKLYPDIFIPKIDTSLATSDTYSYTIPSTMDLILAVRILTDSSSQYEDLRFHTEFDGSDNKLELFEKFTTGLTIKLVGGTRLTVPTLTTSDLDISADAEDLLITGLKIELMEMTLLDKGKMNQFAAREEEVTETDVQNMIRSMRREYTQRKGDINSIIIQQITRI